MAFFLKKPYNWFLFFYDYFLSTWLFDFSWFWTFTLFRRRRENVSSDSIDEVEQIIQRLREYATDKSSQNLAEICRKVRKLNFQEDILSIKSMYNDLDLLQNAIIGNCKEVVQLLLDNSNYLHYVSCNSPCHLAAKLGHTEIVQCLVQKNPYYLYKSAGVCYPESHEPQSFSRRMGLVFQDNYKCEEDRLIPLEWAIRHDHLETVKVVLNLMKLSDGSKFNIGRFLHFSACSGAKRCLEYFVTTHPEEIDNVNSKGDVPLLEAVVWGRECARVLIDNGADVNRVAENEDTALHRLYRNDIDGIFAIFETTRYLLTTGIEQLINAINTKGETALHLLMTHVSYIGGNYFHHEQRHLPRGSMQNDYQEQVIKTIQLLLAFNADPHIHDSLHLQPLNKLLHVTMKASRPNDPFECVQGSINSKYVYRNDFASLKRAVNVLIENGADVNTQCSIGHTPLILLVQALINTEVAYLIAQADDIVDALETLLKNGAKCNFLSEDQRTCCSLLADLAKKVFVGSNRRSNTQDQGYKEKYGDLITRILVIFLKHGLNPNFTTTKKSKNFAGGSGNALIEFVHLTCLARSDCEFRMLHTWLRTLLQWGADPDIEPYPSDPIICHSQSSIYLKRQGTQAVNHYINDVKELQAIFEHGHAEELLLLFYKTMDHKIMFECLTTMCFMARFQPLGETGRSFLAILNSMSDRPRTLKEMARVTIYKSVDRKLMTAIDQLPLPRALKQYLLEIE